MREDENERNEEQTATCCCHDIRTYGLADGLHQHICQHDGGYQREADYLPLQGNGTHGYHAGIITEEFDDRLGEKEAENGTNRQKYRAAFDAEKECLLHTLVQLGSITETAERLEPLTQSDDHGIGEERDSRHDTHTRNGCISVGSCCYIQHQRGDASQALS